MGEAGRRMEGWIYYLNSNRLRLNHPRKRYVVLIGNHASSFKGKPSTKDESPIKVGVIDPYTRVTDQGRETHHGRVFFVFTLHDSYAPQDKLRFGVQNADNAAEWMGAFREAAERAQPPGNDQNFLPVSGGRRRLPNLSNLRRSGRKGSGLVSNVSGSNLDGLTEESTSAPEGDLPNWTGALLAKDASPDVVASSPWQIFGCKNGLRLFKETSDSDGGMVDKIRGEDPPALMAVGVVHGSCGSVFETVMALGPSRAEWDFCFLRGRVLEHVHGHTDIIHKQFHSYWFPRKMKPRDFVFYRYWRREDDGSYVILYNSINHKKCPPSKDFARAEILSGGYVISPLQQGSGGTARCMVKHMMTVDWKDWRSSWNRSRNRDMTLMVLERVAAIRELYKVKDKAALLESKEDEELFFESAEPETEVGKLGGSSHEDGEGRQASAPERRRTFLNIADDEFFDADESTSWEQGEEPELASNDEMEGGMDNEDAHQDGVGAQRFKAVSKAATMMKRLQDLTSAPKNQSLSRQRSRQGSTDEADVEFMRREGSLPSVMWDMADPGTFLIRGKRYLKDKKKIKASNPAMELVAADWFKSENREGNIASRDGCLLQKLFAKQKSAQKVAESYFIIINLQVPGPPCYSLVLYYMANKKLQDIPLLESFVRGDDRYRNSRFKLCPHIAKGSWIVKQSVGNSACLVGEALDITYFTFDNYLELDIDIGSSSVARGVVSLVSGYLTKLVIEMAFLIQANTEEELPERLLGTVKLSNLDMNKAVPPPTP